MQNGFNYTSSEWRGPGTRPWVRGRFRIWPLLKAMVVPPKGERLLPTPTGYVLIIVTLGLLMAAYNTTSNVLFIAASLLMSCIVVSLALSWVNTHGISWRVLPERPMRAGEEAGIAIEVRNAKKRIPSYAIAFVIEAAKNAHRGILHFPHRLEPGETQVLRGLFVPNRRGVDAVRIVSAHSQFPFGFLKKSLNGGPPESFTVWPRRIAYRMSHQGAGVTPRSGQALSRIGQGSEFLNLRDYRYGDSHRQIHWKASARQGSLVVQQFAAESQAGFILCMDPLKSVWGDEEQFERLCSLVSTMAEDLFVQGRLVSARIGRESFRFGRRPDLDFFQDRLAGTDLVEDLKGVSWPRIRNMITFEPATGGAVHAYVGGKRATTV